MFIYDGAVSVEQAEELTRSTICLIGPDPGVVEQQREPGGVEARGDPRQFVAGELVEEQPIDRVVMRFQEWLEYGR